MSPKILNNSHHLCSQEDICFKQTNGHQNDQEIKISLWNKGTKMKLEINLNTLEKAIKE